MDDEGVPGSTPRQDQLMEEASIWFARMRGPDAEMFRPAFETWLDRDPRHLGAYNRAGEVFALGKFLAETPDADTIDRRNRVDPFLSPRARTLALIAGMVLLVIGLGSWANRDQIASFFGGKPQMASQPAVPAPDFERVAAEPGSRNRLVLADGSTVILEPGSLLGTRYGADRRELLLERGRARFDVAHEKRPFIVYAGGGSVTARGTLFDVSLDARNEVTVHLVRGAVDVARPDRTGRAEAGPEIVARLVPGETFSFGATAATRLATAPSGEVLEFEKTPLTQVLAQANRNSALMIRLADPSIGALQVSGRFRIDDPELVAERLAALLNLRTERIGDTEILLQKPSAPR